MAPVLPFISCVEAGDTAASWGHGSRSGDILELYDLREVLLHLVGRGQGWC